MGIGATLDCHNWSLPMEAFLEALVTLARRTRNKALIAFTTIAAIVVMMVVWYVALRAG